MELLAKGQIAIDFNLVKSPSIYKQRGPYFVIVKCRVPGFVAFHEAMQLEWVFDYPTKEQAKGCLEHQIGRFTDQIKKTPTS